MPIWVRKILLYTITLPAWALVLWLCLSFIQDGTAEITSPSLASLEMSDQAYHTLFILLIALVLLVTITFHMLWLYFRYASIKERKVAFDAHSMVLVSAQSREQFVILEQHLMRIDQTIRALTPIAPDPIDASLAEIRDRVNESLALLVELQATAIKK